MNKTGEDFKKAAKISNPFSWHIHDCSICGYPCGYVFSLDLVVAYDSRCYCTKFSDMPMELRSWDDVANYYNMQTNQSYIAEMNKFWGFKESSSPNNEKGLNEN